MRVLLLHPDFPRQLQGLELFKDGFNPPALGTNILASALRAEGHDVEVLDSLRVALRHGPRTTIDVSGEAVRCVRERAFGLVGMNVTSPTRIICLDLAREIKGLAPETRIVFGGPHATLLGRRLLERYGHILDGVVLGEGEESLPALVSALEAGRELPSVPGVCWRGAEAERWPFLQDLDSYPLPDYAPYREEDGQGLFTTVPVMTARGCPHRCGFCYSRLLWSGPLRCRRPERVVDEIEVGLRHTGATKVHFNDDAFSCPLDRAKAVLRGMLRRGIHAELHCNTRIDCLDEEFLYLYEAVGGGSIYFGIESGSERVRRRMCKDLSDDQIRAGMGLMRRHAIRVGFFVMFGYPGETPHDVHLTEALLRQLRPDEVTCNIAHVHPGTALFEQAVREGRYRLDDWLREEHEFFPYERDLDKLSQLSVLCASFEELFGPPLSRTSLSGDIGSVQRDLCARRLQKASSESMAPTPDRLSLDLARKDRRHDRHST